MKILWIFCIENLENFQVLGKWSPGITFFDMEKFKKLGLSKAILKVLEEEKFTEPTEIQEKTIPLVLRGSDVIAGSVTGSGKTLAFGSGIIQNLNPEGKVQALILVPTRELAEQVSNTIYNFSKYKELRVISVYGGVSIEPQISILQRADVVVGTPGRILDHLQRHTINLKNVKILVLDEADRMLDMGFIIDVEKIISHCPKNRQTMMFSATISQDIDNLADRYMKNPIRISAESYIDPSKLTQVYYDILDNMKFSLLVHLLKNEDAKLIMIFCNTQKTTDFVANNLQANGIDAIAIHGGLTQAKRTNILEKFHSKKVEVLVCTDVAARGLDIKNVSHVYNYDLPNDSKQYIHRIGRTARAGKEGKAISILASRDYDNFREIIKDSELNIVSLEVPYIEKSFIKWIPHDSRRRFSGDRRFERKRFLSRRHDSRQHSNHSYRRQRHQ